MNKVPVLTIIHHNTKDSPKPDTVEYKLDWLGMQKRTLISLIAMEDTPYFINRAINEMYDSIIFDFMAQYKDKQLTVEQTWEEHELSPGNNRNENGDD